MSTVQIQLDPIAMREATAQAIMGILTPEVRAEIIRTAISALLKPSTASWDKNKSPIETAFEQAVNHVAREEALKLVKEDAGIRVKLQELLKQTAEQVLGTDIDKLAVRMAEALVSSLRRD